MKKLFLLPLVCLSTFVFAGSYDDSSSHNKWMEFKAIWDEINNGEYGLAFYHLKDMDIDSAETELEVQLFELIIATKTKNKSQERSLSNDIGDDLLYLCEETR